jgi:hypothetical protein
MNELLFDKAVLLGYTGGKFFCVPHWDYFLIIYPNIIYSKN